MRHTKIITLPKQPPLRAESLLVKQAQIDVAGSAVELLGNFSSLVKEWTGQDGGEAST